MTPRRHHHLRWLVLGWPWAGLLALVGLALGFAIGLAVGPAVWALAGW